MAIVITKDDEGFDRLVFAEVIIPDAPNVYGDFHTKQSVRDFAYGFMDAGYGIDVNHDNDDITGKVYVVESFIAREGDKDFIEGAWVVGMYIPDDDMWQGVLDGNLNGYSYEAFVKVMYTDIEVPNEQDRIGTTEPDIYDKHTHEFFVLLDKEGRPLMGGTSITNGHSHSITRHTTTDTAFEHSHIYNFVEGKGGK